MATVTLPEYKSTHCKICGHPSHCGTPLWLEVTDYAVDNIKEPRQIKACYGCSCSECNKKGK